MMASDMGGPLDFSFDVHRPLVNDLDPPPSPSNGWIWTGIPRLRKVLQSTKKPETL